MALPLANCNSVKIVFSIRLRKPFRFNYKIIWIIQAQPEQAAISGRKPI